MIMINHCVFVGNLCDDPNFGSSKNGNACARYRIAVGYPYGKRKDKPLFITITSWGKQAEIDTKTLHKGDTVLVIGDWLGMDTYTGKDGKNYYNLEMNANEVAYIRYKGNRMKSDDPETVPEGYTQVEDDGLPY